METYISKEEMLKYFIAGMGDDRVKEREKGLQQGRQEGLQQGLQQGMQQERNLTALNALKRGLSLKTISSITSLSVAEIKKLQGQL